MAGEKRLVHDADIDSLAGDALFVEGTDAQAGVAVLVYNLLGVEVLGEAVRPDGFAVKLGVKQLVQAV